MTSPTPTGPDIAVGNRIKVWFRFVPREGWLPYDTEGLWATVLSADTARVDNVPFLVEGVAQDDVVRFVTGDDGLHWVTARVEWSGNHTVRVLPAAKGPLGPNARAVHDLFTPYDLGGEAYSAELPLVALNVPPHADLRQIKSLLIRGQDEGWWGFELSCSSDAWEAA
ncbi:DUF4265 domain-containing protein [Streptomyces sp. NBC_00144]|uniref:DUF4265 domain-containing protein n=1 Tax=Streptomyces sp. NBC_00144 TaxID=2975665 RepID=UPI00324405ED